MVLTSSEFLIVSLPREMPTPAYSSLQPSKLPSAPDMGLLCQQRQGVTVRVFSIWRSLGALAPGYPLVRRQGGGRVLGAAVYGGELMQEGRGPLQGEWSISVLIAATIQSG